MIPPIRVQEVVKRSRHAIDRKRLPKTKVQIHSLASKSNTDERQPIRTSWEGVKQFVHEGKRYLDIRGLNHSYRIVGVVVHDDGGVFNTALKGTDFVPLAVDASDRFPVRVVIDDCDCVLLVGTGMGSTGQSVVVYELAMQIPNLRILKIGTCVSTWSECAVGTILVPRKAIADDGVANWDALWRDSRPAKVADVLHGKAVVEPGPELTESWLSRLEHHGNWPSGSALDEAQAGEAVIWSADAFYPLILRPDFFRLLAKGYSVAVDTQGSRKVVLAVPP